MYTKMNASPRHSNGCKVDIYYSSIAQNNAHMWGTIYLTLDSGPSRDNITHNKWEKSWTNPFSVIPHTPIAMHVITTIIMTWEMTCTSRASEKQSKIVLDIRGFGGALRVTVAHVVHVVHWVAIHTWNSMCYRGREEQNVVIKRRW